jgi:peptidyl-prolyl cis-trans isomerase D
MLSALRGSAGGLVAKIFIGLLAASFAVWGVSDVFRGYRSDVLAKAGDAEITSEDYRTAFNRRLRALSGRLGKTLTAEEARNLGVDRQVLAELLRDAALASQAKDLGLAVPDSVVADRVANNPAFNNAKGEFDANDFRRLLQANGLSEREFVTTERQGLVRQAITAAIDSGLRVPDTLVEIAWRQRNEQRDASYFDISAAAVTVPEPGTDEIEKFYAANQVQFMIPERRTIVVLILDAVDLAKTVEVDEKEIEAAYERDKDRFGTPERRKVEQIAFPDQATARAALDRIRAGENFMKIAAERGLTPKDVDLGEVLQTGIPDQAIAKAAFALSQGEVSEPIRGRLAVALVRVTAIIPGEARALADVREELVSEIRLRRAREELLDLHDRIEDARAGGQSFDEIAKTNDLQLLTLESVDSSGRHADGADVADFAGKDEVLKAAFASDVGVENDAVTIGQDGFAWYEVRDVEAAAARPLDSAHTDVIAGWKAQKRRELLIDKARSLQARAEKGEAFDKLAAEAGGEIRRAIALKRNEASDVFNNEAVAALFAAAPDGYAVAIGADGRSARVMHSSPVLGEPFDVNSDEAKAIRNILESGLGNDLFSDYLTELQTAIGIKVNEELWQRVSDSGS